MDIEKEWFFRYQIIVDTDRKYQIKRRNGQTETINANILVDLNTLAEVCYGTYKMCTDMLYILSNGKSDWFAKGVIG